MATDEAQRMTVARLQEFRDAWGRGDVEALMSFMTEDCEYRASVGPEPGETFRGRAAVREGFLRMLAHDRGRIGRQGRCFVAGDRGVDQWSYLYTEGGRDFEQFGC